MYYRSYLGLWTRDAGTHQYWPTEQVMPRTPTKFRQADIVRAVKAARAAGLPVTATQITPDGTIQLIHNADVISTPASDYDRLEPEL